MFAALLFTWGVLGDTYGLYLKTHGYHWNVEGPMFNTLHLMFEAQYNDLWLSMDLIAERIRSLGEYAPVGEQIGAKSQLPVDKGVPDAKAMISNLVEGNELLARSARAAVAEMEASLEALPEAMIAEPADPSAEPAPPGAARLEIAGLSVRSRIYYVGNSSEVHVALDVLYYLVRRRPESCCGGGHRRLYRRADLVPSKRPRRS